MGKWLRQIGQSVVGNWVTWLIAAVAGTVTVWLASLTPIIRLFAPLSYLLAVLVVLLVLAIIAAIGAWATRHIWPAPPNAAEQMPVLDHSPQGVSQEELDAAFEVLKQRIVVVDATYAGHVAGIEAKIKKLEQLSPGDYLAYERWIDLMQEAVERHAAKAKAACQTIMEQGGLSKSTTSASATDQRMMLEGAAYCLGGLINPVMMEVSGKDFDFTAKRILDENPNRYAEGEEKIKNPERQYEYRKAYWTSRQIDSAMAAVKQEFGHARSRVYNAVVKAGPLFKDVK